MMNIEATKKYSLVSIGALAALTLAACGSNDANAPEPDTTTVTVTAEAPSSTTAPSEAAAEPSAANTSEATGAADTSAILAAIDHAEKAREGGFVIQVDEDDNNSSFDIDIVVGDTVHEFDVDAAGTITDEETETDAEEVQKAQDASVTVKEAIETAAQGREGQVATDADLERDNGTLTWEIDFEEADGNDSGTVYVDASSGDIITR